jgi:membrane protein YdbS with pleckstrin-like domain
MTHMDITLEIKRRQRELYKRSLYMLVPFALEMIAAAMHASRVWAAIGFAAIVVGWIIWMVYYYRLSRCPVCNRLLLYLFQTPMLYKRCPTCHTSFTSSS